MGVDPNWSLLNGGSFQNALAQGFQLGQHMRQRNEEKQFNNALAQYDPANPATLKPIMAIDPKTGLALQQQQAQAVQEQQKAAQQQQTQRRNDLPIIDRLLSQVAPDGSNWHQLLDVAQRSGLDVSEVPPNYDPQWVQDTHALVQALQTPQGQQALSDAGRIATDEGLQPGTPEFAQRVHQIFAAQHMKTVPYEAGGGVAAIDPTTGQVTPLIVPNPGGMPSGAPAKAPVRVTSPEEAAKLSPGTQFIDPNGVLRVVPGGAGGNAGGHFPNIERYYGGQ